MDKVFICGHKNPDTDSVASAAAYAYLKTKLDPKSQYIPVRAGNANDQTKFVFQRAGTPLPTFQKDIYPKVADSMSKDVLSVYENDPVSKILKYVREHGIRFTPVTDEAGIYKGMIGMSELTELFVRDDRAAKPVFSLRADSLQRSLKADVLNKGSQDEFSASIIVATMAYEAFHTHVSAVANEKNTILVIGNRKNILDDVFKRDYPAIVLVGVKPHEYKNIAMKDFKGWVFASPFDSAQTIRCVEMATPVKKLMTLTEPALPDDYIDAVSERLSQSSTKSLPIVRDNKLEGIITGTDILKRKRAKLIMVDHNELSQAIDGAETADIMEIVDHHRLGTIKTNSPVTFYAKPVGSTCTLVYELFNVNSVDIPNDIAMLMLCGMISDTVIMKSPTTTPVDIAAIGELSQRLGVDPKALGVEIFSATNGLSARPIKDIVCTDFKMYDEYNVRFGVSQVETVTLREIDDIKQKILDELFHQKNTNNLSWAMILVTDIILEESLLITTGFAAAEKMFAYKKLDEKTFYLPGVLSRKKQLLPEILRILEDIS